MPQAVRRDPLLDAGLLDCFFEGEAHGAVADDATGLSAREQRRPGRPEALPVPTQSGEQDGAEHDVAIAAPLAVADVDEPALAIDVDGGQGTGFADAQAAAVCGHQDDAVLDRLDGVEHAADFLQAQNDGQWTRHLRPGNAGGDLGPAERHFVEESDRGQVHLDRGWLGFLLVDEVGQVLAHLGVTQDLEHRGRVPCLE